MDSESSRKAKKKRKKPTNFTLFSPSFCNTVKTKVGDKFFNLVNIHLPKNSKLSKIYIKNKI